MAATVEVPGRSYARVVWAQFRRNRLALASLVLVGCLGLVAAGADLLAGDKPYYLRYQGQVYFPVARQYGVHLGLMEWPKELRRHRNFKRLEAEAAIYPPIPVAPGEIILGDRYQPPSTEHWLGTDRLGRDVLAGARSNGAAWWLVVAPGLAIFGTVTLYNLLGDGLRDALDPQLRRARAG